MKIIKYKSWSDRAIPGCVGQISGYSIWCDGQDSILQVRKMTPHIISKSQWVHEFHIICLYNANKHLMERWIHVNHSSAVAFGALKCFIWLYLSINCLYILSWIFNYCYYLHTPVTKICLMAQNGPMCLMTCKLLDIDLMYILVISPFHYSKSYDVAVKYNGVRHATVTMLAIVVKADFFSEWPMRRHLLIILVYASRIHMRH